MVKLIRYELYCNKKLKCVVSNKYNFYRFLHYT